MRYGVLAAIIGAIQAFPGRSLADSVARCADGGFPGDYIDSGAGRIWCAQEGAWNAIPVLFAFFHPLSPWVPILLGVAAVAVGGTLTGHPATISGWVSGGRIVSAIYHPAIPGSASLLLRLLGALLIVGGFVVLGIGVIFALTG